MHTNLNRPYLASHDFRDLFVLEVLIPAQNEHFTFFRRQLVQGAFKELSLLLMLQVVNREGRPAFEVFCDALRKRVCDFMLLVMVETRVSSDLVHPRLKTALGSKRLAVL